MKKNLFNLVILICLFTSLLAQETEVLEKLLSDLPDIKFKRIKDIDSLPVYMLGVKQLVDHKNPEQGYFQQRIRLIHRGFEKNMVINTNGYTLAPKPSELLDVLASNYIDVEHRYFGQSTPDPKNWNFLTIQQVAADYHYIKSLLSQIYQKKWISTGISKGGETATYYKHFYPDDVAVCIPYVAPFPNDLIDKRLYAFLDTMGSKKCREQIFNFQNNVLKNKKAITSLLKFYLKGKGETVELLGGTEAALEIFVLEYPFSFWQNGYDCSNIPADSADIETLLLHLLEGEDLLYLVDNTTTVLAAHYYQHATQLGYYGYRTEPFGDLIEHWEGEISACFFPEGKLNYDRSTFDYMMKWLQGEAENIIFLYGATDTWTAAQADIGMNSKIKKYIFPNKDHKTARLKKIDPKLKEEILDWIKKRL